MKSRFLSSLLAAAAWTVSTASAQSFENAAAHLDLDGEFVAYADFQGDGAEVAAKLGELYAEVLRANPGVPPIPVDFNQVFTTLGFGNVGAFAMSSKALENGLIRNQWFTGIAGEPSGLLAVYGLDPVTFRAAEIAPADATTVATADLRLTAFRDSLVALIVQIMGPMGEGIAQQALASPLPGTDITYDELIGLLSGPIDVVLKQELSLESQFNLHAWIRFAEAGNVLERLTPLAETMPVTFEQTAEGYAADFSALIPEEGMRLLLLRPTDSNDLVLMTHPDWISGTGVPAGDRLADTEAFQRVTAHLPETAAAFSYSGGLDLGGILDALSQDPSMAAYVPIMRKAIDLFLAEFLAPSSSAYYGVEDGIIQVQYSNISYKEALMLVPAGVGFGAAIAIVQAQQARATQAMEGGWIEEAVTMNLAQISSAAQQYLLETGAEEVSFGELQGAGDLAEIESIAGE